MNHANLRKVAHSLPTSTTVTTRTTGTSTRLPLTTKASQKVGEQNPQENTNLSLFFERKPDAI